MSSFSKQEQLCRLIDEQQERIRQNFPATRSSVVVALTRARDWDYLQSLELRDQDMLHTATQSNTAQNSYLYSSGWHKALQLCFSKATKSPLRIPIAINGDLDSWADQLLLECARLAASEQVLAHCETGFMSMQQGGQRDFHVWVASKKMPTEWRERVDLAWWADALARAYEREMQELAAEKGSIQQQLNAFVDQWQADKTAYKTTPEIDDYYRRLGMLRVKSMACHLLYPSQTLIGGCTIELYRDVLAALIGFALKHLDLCRTYAVQQNSYSHRSSLATSHKIVSLVEALSARLRVDSAAIRRVVDAFSLDHENVSYHCSIVGTPAPPLLWLDEQHLIWSLTGLLSEPFLFLTRELKLRYSDEYHTASHRHEGVFRQDLYQLFADKRFVKSASSLELRGVQGDLTTDVDALIFDRKTGALALFELKSQDPFAYSRQERRRQRDYFYNAGKQVLACMQWLKRNGANALLSRLDPKLVKRLKVQKTYIFVLGRYLAHFADGPEFDRRAAWGTWPQVLWLLHEGPSGAQGTNPIQSLHNKLMKDTPLAPISPMHDVQEIPIGESKVYVYPDFQTYKSQVR